MIGLTAEYRLEDGAAPWYMVFPAMIAVFLIASSVDEINKYHDKKRSKRFKKV